MINGYVSNNTLANNQFAVWRTFLRQNIYNFLLFLLHLRTHVYPIFILS